MRACIPVGVSKKGKSRYASVAFLFSSHLKLYKFQLQVQKTEKEKERGVEKKKYAVDCEPDFQVVTCISDSREELFSDKVELTMSRVR